MFVWLDFKNFKNKYQYINLKTSQNSFKLLTILKCQHCLKYMISILY